ncbi:MULTISPECIES: NAD(P)/FAD-dependent oxidoreductase [unclassified Mesorhizobium]|uniref:phytoene desaturase family protein n=1 Tax=unclassified Mesorhizobium TaxID=325217 RepID=UPI000F7544C5|nr:MULTISPECIES: NAD(P)/FAD-dependent oxidoreductase [unclassified Mesorhizobium]AZO52712.1 NAD(P)/FAD-dependent oxidoreductase [Mesorhizobium sp. M8A.F.Ca.ET.057.01.1.1]RWE45448.1 MAG: NAD(P)/FAD-dependent oxidoreductase [Mesorhizobium sp.]
MTLFDGIVIGGGHNGLVAAATLAKAGRKVLVLEAAAELGGAARTEEFAPGFRVSSIAHVLNRLHPDVMKTLELEKHGLQIARADFLPSVSLSKDGPALVLHGAYGEVLTGASSAEQSAWKELRAQLLRYAGILKRFLPRRPPDVAGMSLKETAALGQTALALKKLGKEDMRDFLRVLLMNVADLLDEQLADDRLKGLLAFDATLGSHLGPRSPTSLLGLYYCLAGETGGAAGAQILPKGGMGAVVTAIHAAAEKAGVAIRTSVPVARIIVEKGRAVGVVLDNGEELRARTIVSAINPATTFLDLVGPRAIDTGFTRKVKNIRMKGDAAKLHLALDRPPQFTGADAADHQGRLVIAPSPDHVERAFNPCKYGEFSHEPVMEVTLPSLADPSLAPDGACVLSAVVQYAPYQLKDGWDAGKPKFVEAIMAQLEAYAPGIGKTVRHTELLTPADIEKRYRMPGGHWHHGELQADQMLISRPVSGWSGYDTPLDGLFLASAGSHPGGGVSGAPGLNAARRIIAMKG